MIFELMGAVANASNVFCSEDLTDFFQSIPQFFSTLNSYLPQNRLIRVIIYGSGVFGLVQLSPYILRHTEWFDYYYRHMSYFHRYCPYIDEQKAELFNNMTENLEHLPKYDGKFMVLEIQAGGGSSLMYYPKGTRLIAVDHDEKYEEQMLANFDDDNDTFLSHVTLERFICTCPEELIGIPDCTISAIVSIHSLCYPAKLDRCLDEFKRVLMPGGRVYFLEHTEEEGYLNMKSLTQLRFIFVFALVRCHLRRRTQDYISQAGFSNVHIKHFNLGMEKITTRPLQVLEPHILGYAVK